MFSFIDLRSERTYLFQSPVFSRPFTRQNLVIIRYLSSISFDDSLRA